MVTISPFAICATSCPNTASSSSRVMFCNSPVDTATNASSRLAPVANAFGSPSYTATSGRPMPAFAANRCTVSSNHCSVELAGYSITCAPVDHFAIGLLINKEKIAPVKPTTSENTNNMPTLSPWADKNRSTPSTDNTIDMTAITATFVSTNKRIRFID